MGTAKIVETRIKDGPKKRSSSETKVKKIAKDVESIASAASPVQIVKTLAAMETPQGAGI